MPEDEASLDEALKELIERYGHDEVVKKVRGAAPRQAQPKKGGAPSIDRDSRDALILALVIVLRAGTGHSVSWCCQRLSKNAKFRIRELRDKSAWKRVIYKTETFRRHFNRSIKRTDEEFETKVAYSLQSLGWWRKSKNPKWGFMTACPSGLHIDLEFSQSMVDSLHKGIDTLLADVHLPDNQD